MCKSLQKLIEAMRLTRKPFEIGSEKYFFTTKVKVDREGTYDEELYCKAKDITLDEYVDGGSRYKTIDNGVFIYDDNTKFALENDKNGNEVLKLSAVDPKRAAIVYFYANNGDKMEWFDDKGVLHPYLDVSKFDSYEFEIYEFKNSKYLLSRSLKNNNCEEDFVVDGSPKMWQWNY